MNKKTIVLLSGGMDSATCLAIAKSKNYECYILSFDYGQRSISELNAAKRIAKSFEVSEHRIINMRDIGNFGGSAITDHDIPLKIDNHTNEIPSSYVPARNTVFLSIALSWAEAVMADNIFIGIHNDDRSCYPDCRPEYIKKYQEMANIANRRGVEGNPIVICTPLLNLTKSEIIITGSKLGVNYADTVTCYQADENGFACGNCLSCYTRKEGFRLARIPDPTRYKSLVT